MTEAGESSRAAEPRREEREGSVVRLVIGRGEGSPVEGSIEWDGLDGPARFSGWLELLRLLEAVAAAGQPAGRPASGIQD